MLIFHFQALRGPAVTCQSSCVGGALVSGNLHVVFFFLVKGSLLRTIHQHLGEDRPQCQILKSSADRHFWFLNRTIGRQEIDHSQFPRLLRVYVANYYTVYVSYWSGKPKEV